MLRIVVPVLCDARAGESKPEQLIVHSGAQAVDRVGAAGRQVYGSKNRRDIISATAMVVFLVREGKFTVQKRIH
jgi:hypothetical protein